MSTYGDMQTRIADELMRSDLTTQIQQAIQDSIKKYERQSFYFNGLEGTNVFSTVNGQEFYTSADYAAIATIAQLTRVHVLISSNRYTLNPRTWGYLEDISVNPAVTGQPTDYAYFNKTLRFYMIPNGIYPITLVGTQRLAALSASGDTNAWVDDAEELIRCAAVRRIHQRITLDADKMQLAAGGEQEAIGDLRAETSRRQGGAAIRPTNF